MDDLAPLLGRTLVIVAHPDDEAVTCGALMQRMREAVVLFCTDGAPLDAYFWTRHGSREAYAALRQKEAQSALAMVGVNHVQFLRAPRSGQPITDQHLFEHLDEAIAGVLQAVDHIRPEALLTLAYEGGHPDHDSCNFITSVVARARSLPAWEMPVYSLFHQDERKFQKFIPAPGPELELHPAREEIARKRRMLAAYSSQGHFLLNFDAATERFRRLAEYDYSRRPHEGVLNYEAWQWPMTGEQVAAAFAAYLREHAVPQAAERR